MNARDQFTYFHTPADRVFARRAAGTAAERSVEHGPPMHNARGLVIAVMLSAACWGVIGVALFA